MLRRFYIVSLFILICLPCLNAQIWIPFDTEISIWTEGERFYARRPVWVFIRIINRGALGPRIAGIPLLSHFVILDAEGNRLSMEPRPDDLQNSAQMRAGAVIEQKVNIAKSYFVLGQRDPYIPPGRYEIQFTWEEPEHDPLVSNTVNIIISNPKDDELDALKLLNEGDKMYRLKKTKASDACYEQLVERFPNSMYAADALDLVFRNHLGRPGAYHREVRMRTAKRILENYPDSEKNFSVLFYELEQDYRAAKDLTGFEDYLKTLAGQTPNPAVQFLAQKALRRVTNKKL